MFHAFLRNKIILATVTILSPFGLFCFWLSLDTNIIALQGAAVTAILAHIVDTDTNALIVHPTIFSNFQGSEDGFAKFFQDGWMQLGMGVGANIRRMFRGRTQIGIQGCKIIAQGGPVSGSRNVGVVLVATQMIKDLPEIAQHGGMQIRILG